MARILLLSTSDTDLLGARASEAPFTWANPTRVSEGDLADLLAATDLVVFRFLGSAEALPPAFGQARESGLPVVVLGGEQTPDAALMARSTVPQGVAAQAHRYLAEGGPDNLRSLHAFLADTVLLTGDVFEAPSPQPLWGLLDRPVPADPTAPKVGILYYRAQHTAGNTAYVEALADAVDAAGGIGAPIHVTSLRDAPADLLAHLTAYDALVTTVLAAGGTRPAQASAGGDDDAWDVQALAALDVPILQGLCLTWGRQRWESSDEGMSPLDVATQVAVPEFDGRIIGTAFSFKETDADGLPSYVPDPERCRRLATLAVNHARLRRTPPEERRVAIVLSAYPSKHSRIGNAVGRDTPVSVVRLLRAMGDAGYDLGAPGEIPGTEPLDPVDGESPNTTAGNALIHALIEAGGQDEDWLTQEQLSGQPVRIAAARYREYFESLPERLRDAVVEHWGAAPGEVFVDRHADPEGEIVAASLRAGNVVILIQPPRGFGENPIAVYHDPDLPPTHHYLAVYDWLARDFGAHAIVHMGKHGNLEWLPGKNLALSPSCGPDATVGSVPLVYPFLVNDPGEGSQAKRRAHATIVDHLVPPMARAESYGDIARLEQLLDEHANIAAMDPAKLPAIRGEIWQLMHAAEMHRDLGLDEQPDDEEFDDFIMHVDGWLCEIKDAQIRDGRHVLGEAPSGEARVNLVLAILRAAQVFGGQAQAVPGLRTALGLDSDATVEVDRIEAIARDLVEQMDKADWDPARAAELHDDPEVQWVLEFAATQVVPRLASTTDELS